VSTRCSVEHCNNVAKYRGRCSSCYNWWHKHDKVDRVLPSPDEITEEDDVIDILPQWQVLAAEHLREHPNDEEIVEIVSRQYRFTLDEQVLRQYGWYMSEV
jgi:hypothetical protein